MNHEILEEVLVEEEAAAAEITVDENLHVLPHEEVALENFDI